jgi:hypothetical protein
MLRQSTNSLTGVPAANHQDLFRNHSSYCTQSSDLSLLLSRWSLANARYLSGITRRRNSSTYSESRKASRTFAWRDWESGIAGTRPLVEKALARAVENAMSFPIAGIQVSCKLLFIKRIADINANWKK